MSRMFANRRKFSRLVTIRVEEHDGDDRPEVEIWLFRACARKNMHYNPYLLTNRQNCHVLQGIRVKEVDSDVRFQTGCRNMAVQTQLLWTFLCGI